MTFLRKITKNSKGATAIEYGLIARSHRRRRDHGHAGPG